MIQYIKYLLYILVGISIIIGGLYTYNTRSVVGDVVDTVAQEHQEVREVSETVLLTIEYGGGKDNTIDVVAMKAGDTVADALITNMEHGGVQVQYKDYGGEMGLFIQKIGGVPSDEDADNTKWWQFWVNGEYSNKGASSVMLKSGDEVVWRYTNSQQ